VLSQVGIDDPAPIGQCGHDDQIDIRQRQVIWTAAMREPGYFDRMQPQWGLLGIFVPRRAAAGVVHRLRGLLALCNFWVYQLCMMSSCPANFL
jgi:hypothetical protein